MPNIYNITNLYEQRKISQFSRYRIRSSSWSSHGAQTQTLSKLRGIRFNSYVGMWQLIPFYVKTCQPISFYVGTWQPIKLVMQKCDNLSSYLCWNVAIDPLQYTTITIKSISSKSLIKSDSWHIVIRLSHFTISIINNATFTYMHVS